MKIDIQNLLKLAGEATPGPWKEASKPVRHSQRRVIVKLHEQYVGICRINAGVHDSANAQLIAACSPEVIKALCEVVVASRNWLRDGAVGRGSVEHLNALTKALEPFTEE